MIIYKSTKKEFLEDAVQNRVDEIVNNNFIREMGYGIGRSERLSWKNSLKYMESVLVDEDIPNSAGIAIEYKIPQTSKRIDFIITGKDNDKRNKVIIIELKQWESAEMTDLDGIIRTYLGSGKRELSHPSYQVWSYASLLEDFNSSIQEKKIALVPCAYLHNYEPDNVINNTFYQNYLNKAPVFLKHDAIKLRSFIKKHVKYGDKDNIIYVIEKGKIRPSKSLIDSLSNMIKGQDEFTLIDDQKLVYEKCLKSALRQKTRTKSVVIIEGGPGTGKSVVAINLLVELTKNQQLVHYVTKNSAPREVFQIKLSGSFTKTRISNLFKSSGSYYDSGSNTFDTLIVDEAHRLNAKSGLYANMGDNQIKEIINSSRCAIFFIDEDQRVTINDIGQKKEIIKYAKETNAKILEMSLESQFRCNGSDGYLSWLDNVLQIKNTANYNLDDIDYDFKIYSDPNKLHSDIISRNKLRNKSRLVAGYCWDWVSRRNYELYDINIGEFSAKWNLNSHGQSWIIHRDSVTEVGCIHTCQGLELDYVGVIIGPDLIVRNGVIITDPTKRAKTDQSLKGIKKLLKENPQKAISLSAMIIKNTYRTLMTRGMKGCYIFSDDFETREYFSGMLNNKSQKYESDYKDNNIFTADV